jgi:hypothetical protein
VRVDGIYNIATWLLNANSNKHWDRDAIVDTVREGGQKRIDLAKAVPVVGSISMPGRAPMAQFIIGRMFTAWAQEMGIKRGGRRDVVEASNRNRDGTHRRTCATPRATLALRFGPELGPPSLIRL